MAPTLNQEIGLRRGSDGEVSLPAVLPASLEAPLDYSLPRNAAGQMRSSRLSSSRSQRRLRVNWMELGTIGLAVASAVVSVYRLLWAIH